MIRFVLVVGMAVVVCRGATLEVGPGKRFARPCDAITAAHDGDTVEIDAAGRYVGDVCVVTANRLTLRGVNGRPILAAGGRVAQGKAIWVIRGRDVFIENLEFTGAVAPDRNGAGIRHEGGNLTIRNCFFHHNENGILTASNPQAELLIEFSEFAWNGAGDGLSHNMYISHLGRFVLQFSYSHDAREGHLVKSRAAETRILYNRLSTETSNASLEIDIPNGGNAWIIGNLIYQGANSANGNMLAFQLEGPHPENPGESLYVVHNTFVNERFPMGVFIATNRSLHTPPVILNNIFDGPGRITTHTFAKVDGNLQSPKLKYVAATQFDYRPAPDSPAVDAAVPIPRELEPRFEYSHPACGVVRLTKGKADVGAFEAASARGEAVPGAPARCRQPSK